jgi:hypothetical protein
MYSCSAVYWPQRPKELLRCNPTSTFHKRGVLLVIRRRKRRPTSTALHARASVASYPIMNAQDSEATVLEEQPRGHIFSINPWWSIFEEQRLKTKRAIGQVVAAADPERLRRHLDVFQMRTKRLETEIETAYGSEGFEVTLALIGGDKSESTARGPSELFWTDGKPFKETRQILGFEDFVAERTQAGWWAIRCNRYTRPGIKPKTFDKAGPYQSDLEVGRRFLQWRLEDIFKVGIWDGSSYESVTEPPLQCMRITGGEFLTLLDAQYQYKEILEPRFQVYCESVMAARTKEQLSCMIALAPSLRDAITLTLDQIVDLELLQCWFTMGYAMLPVDILAQRLFRKFDVSMTPKALEKRCRRLHLLSLRFAQPKIADTDLFLGVP